MKNFLKIIIPIVVFVFSFMFLFETKPDIPKDAKITGISKLEIPENIQIILDKSCIVCHSDKSKNTKGKMKLNFNHFTDGKYSVGKLAGKLRGITKVLGKSSMPPKKFLSKYPEKALTSDESKTLLDWANEQGKALMKK